MIISIALKLLLQSFIIRAVGYNYIENLLDDEYHIILYLRNVYSYLKI